MRLYQMDHGWYFSVPDNWTAERDSQDGHYLFYAGVCEGARFTDRKLQDLPDTGHQRDI